LAAVGVLDSVPHPSSGRSFGLLGEGKAASGGEVMGWIGILLIVLLVLLLLGGFGYARR
jgi:hypothetical protein